VKFFVKLKVNRARKP